VATSVEDQIHAAFVAQEEARCRELEAETSKELKRRDVPKPWRRFTPQALLQDPDLLQYVKSIGHFIVGCCAQSSFAADETLLGRTQQGQGPGQGEMTSASVYEPTIRFQLFLSKLWYEASRDARGRSQRSRHVSTRS